MYKCRHISHFLNINKDHGVKIIILILYVCSPKFVSKSSHTFKSCDTSVNQFQWLSLWSVICVEVQGMQKRVSDSLPCSVLRTMMGNRLLEDMRRWLICSVAFSSSLSIQYCPGSLDLLSFSQNSFVAVSDYLKTKQIWIQIEDCGSTPTFINTQHFLTQGY